MVELESVEQYIGLAVMVANSSGVTHSLRSVQESAEQLYTAWGTARYTSNPGTPTSFRFTGQRRENYLDLYWYGSRWYDPSAARFIQADSIVPQEQGVQALLWRTAGFRNPWRYG